ncbi:hypothetical protein LU631_18470 [Erwinia tracheiphila]|uniref:Uncharacterized protein n=1 Tax=Erwinia tracheiphila TaxID=65700 RepID=A0A0M2KD53_9GAMM|nr:hypothetical protein [Erwinia tracheiphila]EOS96288.1 hypothetical protein ETR_03669 [Erwinia tracheiphila PSU-1]KKF35168.1 hypothetical protein SY86_06575 [Erwinia tracheiphila]UIA86822.1 hypothetical protein LU631_18470 [Erwinia tracheiphila]UIA95178.1 hypothetical protein LU633_16930 [Erwinia tracheiphila]
MPASIYNNSPATLISHHTPECTELKNVNSADLMERRTSQIAFVHNSNNELLKNNEAMTHDADGCLYEMLQPPGTSNDTHRGLERKETVLIFDSDPIEEIKNLIRLPTSPCQQRAESSSALCRQAAQSRSNDSPHIIIEIPESELNRVAHREAPESWQTFFQRHVKNTGTILTRNAVSVGIPTAAREYVRRSALPALFKTLPQAAQVSLAGVSVAMPVVLQLAAIVRDIKEGTQTPESLRSRLANIALVVGTGTALATTGGLSSAANALIAAVFVYVPVRDLSQYFLQLQDNNEGSLNIKATAFSATAYAGNQIAVDQGMNMLSDALEPVMGKLAANIVGRALVNIGGETLDELTSRGANAYVSNNAELKIDIDFRPRDEITRKTALDQVCNTLASRASLFSAAFSGAYAVPVQGILNSMVVGGILGAGYIPFVYSHAQKR